MAYKAENYDALIGTTGMSDTLLKNHFTLYQGYVLNTNKVSDILAQMQKDEKTNTPEFAELKRRFGWEFNGMRLHELYFGNVKKGGVALDQKSKLSKELILSFGSYDAWATAFKAVGTMRGIGWVVFCYDPEEKRFFNQWVNEHDVGHLASTVPLLIMDVFEHAYMVDYGLKRADYIEAFFKAIDWTVVQKRFEKH